MILSLYLKYFDSVRIMEKEETKQSCEQVRAVMVWAILLVMDVLRSNHILIPFESRTDEVCWWLKYEEETESRITLKFLALQCHLMKYDIFRKGQFREGNEKFSLEQCNFEMPASDRSGDAKKQLYI
jgi:hypothetical protein